MKKYPGFIILGIIFIVFSVIFLVTPVPKTPTFWAAYIFFVISLLFQIPVWNSALGHSKLKDKFMGFSIIHIAVVYLIVQFVVTLATILIPDVPVWIPVIISTILLGIASISIIGGNVAGDTIRLTEEDVHNKVSFIRIIQSDIDILMLRESDMEIRRQLQILSEAIRYSDPMSDESLSTIEDEIQAAVKELYSENVNRVACIANINNLLSQRNIKCKALKS